MNRREIIAGPGSAAAWPVSARAQESPQAAREFNVTLMTLWRWDRDPRLAELGWEPPVKIRRRNYRRRRPLEKFKAALRNFGITALRRKLPGIFGVSH